MTDTGVLGRARWRGRMKEREEERDMLRVRDIK